MLAFGSWEPDKADYQNPGSTNAKNVLSITSTSYGPMDKLASVVDALPNRPQGANAFRASDGSIATFSGDINDLYVLAATVWDEISSTTGAYTTATDDVWEFVQYGDRVIAVNGHTDLPQNYVMTVDAVFSDLAAAAPKAKHVAVINNFVMVGNTSDPTDGLVPNRVWWCAINDPTNWPTIGSSAAAQVQSDKQDLPTGGEVQHITGAVGGADGAVFMEKSIYRVTYEGAPLVFSFQEVERGRGAFIAQSVVNVGPFAAYIGEDGFFLFDGSKSIPIGAQKVDEYFFNDLDFNYIDRVSSAADPVNKQIYWAYPSVPSSDGTPDKLICYNWETQRWTYGEQSCFILFSDLTKSYTLDQLDAFGSIDALGTPLDSRTWIAGQKTLSGFSSTFNLSTFTGGALPATITSTEFGGMEIFNKPNERMYVDGVRPYVNGGDYTVSLIYRDSPSGAVLTDGPSTVDSNGMAGFTRSCRYGRIQVDVAEDALWTHAQGVDIRATEDGEF